MSDEFVDGVISWIVTLPYNLMDSYISLRLSAGSAQVSAGGPLLPIY